MNKDDISDLAYLLHVLHADCSHELNEHDLEKINRMRRAGDLKPLAQYVEDHA